LTRVYLVVIRPRQKTVQLCVSLIIATSRRKPDRHVRDYCENLDLYMAGTIDQAESQPKRLRLVIKVMKAVQLKCG